MASRPDLAFLRQVPMFKDLDERVLHALWPSLSERRLRRGEVLCRVGDPGDEQRRSATIQAETDTMLLVLHRDQLNEFIESSPRDAAKFFLEMTRVTFNRLRLSSELVAEVTRWGLEATGLDVEHIVPQHCTGIEAIGAVMQRLPGRFTASSVGTTFEFAAP